jgi:hypothetical protein
MDVGSGLLHVCERLPRLFLCCGNRRVERVKPEMGIPRVAADAIR